MGIAAYVKGAVIQYNNTSLILSEEIEPGRWLLRDQSTALSSIMTLPEMQKDYAGGRLVFRNHSTAALLPPLLSGNTGRPPIIQAVHANEKLDKAKIRRQYVLAVMDLPVTKNLLEPAIRRIWEKLQNSESPPHWITVTKWKNKFIHGSEDIESVIDINGKKGKWPRYPKEVIAIVRKAIDSYYMTRTPKTIDFVVTAAVMAVKRENSLRPAGSTLPEPTRRLVKRLISEIPAFDRYVAHHGRTAANNKFRGTLNIHVTESPLERVEMDHTQLDLFVLRDKDYIPLGRPYVTTMLDTHTRCVLGIHLGFEPPSYLTAARCLRHAILPKIDLQEIYPNIVNPWHSHGIPGVLVLDNGPEFHSLSFEKACLFLNITPEYSPRKEPWHKGMIERYQGTMNLAITHGIGGTTFSNIFKKEDYDPAEHALITMSDLRMIVHKWIADVYHQKPHSGLGGIPPAVVWDSSIRQQDIRIADDPRRLDVILGTSAGRQLTGKGISLHNLAYNSPELHALFRRFGNDGKGIPVELRIDEGDLGHIHVIVPGNSGHVIRVPALDQNYANGTSLWMHKVFRRFAAEHSYKQDPTGWMQAQMEISAIVEQSLGRRKRKSNAKAARYLEAGNQIVRDQATLIASTDESLSTPYPVEHVEEPCNATSAPARRIRRVYDAIIETR